MNEKVVLIIGVSIVLAVVLVSMVLSVQHQRMLDTISESKVQQDKKDSGLVKTVLSWIV